MYGSPLYNPPEIFQKNIPERENILVWNIGMIFFQLIFNTNPFEKYKEYDDINNNDIKNIYHINNNIDTDLIDIIFNMISIDWKHGLKVEVNYPINFYTNFTIIIGDNDNVFGRYYINNNCLTLHIIFQQKIYNQ